MLVKGDPGKGLAPNIPLTHAVSLPSGLFEQTSQKCEPDMTNFQ